MTETRWVCSCGARGRWSAASVDSTGAKYVEHAMYRCAAPHDAARVIESRGETPGADVQVSALAAAPEPVSLPRPGITSATVTLLHLAGHWQALISQPVRLPVQGDEWLAHTLATAAIRQAYLSRGESVPAGPIELDDSGTDDGRAFYVYRIVLSDQDHADEWQPAPLTDEWITGADTVADQQRDAESLPVLWCEPCGRRTTAEPPADRDAVSGLWLPYCGTCGEPYQCGECGYDIDSEGYCQRADESVGGPCPMVRVQA